MTRRTAISLSLLAPAWALAPASTSARLRGRLVHSDGQPPILETADGRRFRLEADPESLAVLHDERVRTELFEAAGQPAPPDAFRLDPIYRKAMFVVRDGKPLVITYWCEVCAIRTYSPGRCQCCQDETAFDPRDPALEDQAR
jgi:hypothetical protein